LKKVSFCGMDFEPLSIQSFSDLYKFFNCLNKGRNIPGVDSICLSLLSSEIPAKKIARQIFDNKGLDSFLNPEEKKFIGQSLKLADYSEDIVKRLVDREHAFYDNFIIGADSLIKLGQRATLYAHFEHLNYVNKIRSSAVNAGYYFRNKYKDNYSCVGLLTSKGTITHLDFNMKNDSIKPIEVELRKTPPFSLESELGKLVLDSLYLPTENMDCSFYSSCRMTGQMTLSVNDQLVFPINPKSRADGFIYLKQVHAMKKEKTKDTDMELLKGHRNRL